MNYIQKTKLLIATWLHSKDPAAREKARGAILSCDDLGHFDDLKATLAQMTGDRERAIVYWMLEVLLRHTRSTEVAEFLMEQVGREPKKAVQIALLEKIGGQKGKGIRIRDASIALACLAEKMRKLRTAAIDALGCCADPRAETALIELAQDQLHNSAESGWYLHGVLWSLSEIATARALPCMLEIIAKIDQLPFDTRKRDIEAMAVKTVVKVGGAKHVELFCDLLSTNKAPVVKWHAMRGLSRHAKKTHVRFIDKRVRAILASKRLIPQTEPPFIAPDVGLIVFLNSEGEEAKKTELHWGFEALARLKAFKDRKLVQYLREKWPALTAMERAFLNGTTEDFADLPTE